MALAKNKCLSFASPLTRYRLFRRKITVYLSYFCKDICVSMRLPPLITAEPVDRYTLNELSESVGFNEYLTLI
jgi:hypothetical protein